MIEARATYNNTQKSLKDTAKKALRYTRNHKTRFKLLLNACRRFKVVRYMNVWAQKKDALKRP